jgi:hypothetical protein
MMQDTLNIHRDAYGAIDIDFYRTRATALRGQAMRNAAALRTTSVGALVMASALGFAIAIPSAAAGQERLAAGWLASSLIR